jgi:hypothetical protein
MAWEDRNGNFYYYRKRREGKRVISEYIGNGLSAQIAEIFAMEDRAETQQARVDWLKQKRSAEMMDKRINELERYTKAVTRAVLLVSGYHLHCLVSGAMA